MWIRAKQSRVHAVEMNYLRKACEMTRWDGENNESIMRDLAWVDVQSGVKVVEWVKRKTLRWFGHTEMKHEEFVKKMYLSESEGLNRKGRYRAGEYMYIRGAGRGVGLEKGKRECLDRERWRLFCCGHPSGGSKASETMQRWCPYQQTQ